MTNSELIKNYTLFHAYFCHIIESNQVESTLVDLCEISWQLEKEINRRNISENQIEECIKATNFDPQDQLMLCTYIYPDSKKLNGKIVHS